LLRFLVGQVVPLGTTTSTMLFTIKQILQSINSIQSKWK